MSGRFAVGAIFGGLAVLSPPITLASLAIGAWILVFHGTPEGGGDTATEGFLWVTVWATVLFGVLLAIVAVALGMWFRPGFTVVAIGGILILYVLVPTVLERWTGEPDPPAGEER
ncbi:hypothetical protein [Halorubrum sp. FL23]|uniref:hypothetical protein n=1 Tax=Halorubrum sp. FL23 TaxID=3458704 RepID=UPI004034C1D6